MFHFQLFQSRSHSSFLWGSNTRLHCRFLNAPTFYSYLLSILLSQEYLVFLFEYQHIHRPYKRFNMEKTSSWRRTWRLNHPIRPQISISTPSLYKLCKLCVWVISGRMYYSTRGSVAWPLPTLQMRTCPI